MPCGLLLAMSNGETAGFGVNRGRDRQPGEEYQTGREDTHLLPVKVAY
jgi:hypothetical protein